MSPLPPRGWGYKAHGPTTERPRPSGGGAGVAYAGGNSERHRIALAIEAQIRHLRAVPPDVTEVSRDLMAMDLEILAEHVRRGGFA